MSTTGLTTCNSNGWGQMNYCNPPAASRNPAASLCVSYGSIKVLCQCTPPVFGQTFTVRPCSNCASGGCATDTVVAACTTCAAGTFTIGQCGSGGPVYGGRGNLLQLANAGTSSTAGMDTKCSACSTCPTGTYASTPCTPGSPAVLGADTVCSACTVAPANAVYTAQTSPLQSHCAWQCADGTQLSADGLSCVVQAPPSVQSPPPPPPNHPDAPDAPSPPPPLHPDAPEAPVPPAPHHPDTPEAPGVISLVASSSSTEAAQTAVVDDAPLCPAGKAMQVLDTDKGMCLHVKGVASADAPFQVSTTVAHPIITMPCALASSSLLANQMWSFNERTGELTHVMTGLALSLVGDSVTDGTEVDLVAAGSGAPAALWHWSNPFTGGMLTTKVDNLYSLTDSMVHSGEVPG
jgi:hypothetical protein